MNFVHPETNQRYVLNEAWVGVFKDIVLQKGYVHIDLKRHNPGETGVLLIRHTGGLGDIICLIPSINSLIEKFGKVTLCLPVEYQPLFKRMKHVNFIPYGSVSYTQIASQYEYVYDMYCPCGDHELSLKYHPTKSRIENFAEFLEVEPGSFDIGYNKEKGKRFRFIYKMALLHWKSATETKDIPMRALKSLYMELQKDYEVYFVHHTPIKDYSSIAHLNLEGLMRVVNNSSLVICPDSGLFHLAGLFDVPAIGIFGPTNGEITSKYYPKAKYIQLPSNGKCKEPCYYSGFNGFYCKEGYGDCMRNVNVDNVLRLVKGMV